jgi:NAD(P)-dependent dehydrogenase (short-subunit alcohol dehydrogenase family)
LGVPAETYAVDVREYPAMKAAAEDFMAKHGVPDLVIGNAGISIGTATESAEDISVFREVLDINVVGLMNTVQPFLAQMRSKRSGRIVGIASVAGYRGLPGAAAYCASKAAAIRYLESLRVELRHTGVKVTTICPGYIATPMTAKNPYPMPFILTADDFARRFSNAVDSRKSYAVIPWQMAIVARILTLMPNRLYDAAFARAGRKPRRV